MTPPATATLAEFAVSMQTKELAPEVWRKAGVCLLDAIGLGVKGGQENTAAAVRNLFTVAPGGEGATVWFDGSRMSLLDAVLTNGVAVHAHFQDDCDMTSWSHPGSMITPVAVGVAEAQRSSLAVALRALVAGYAALHWLGADELLGRAVVSRGLRASPTLGPVGAAVAGSVALGLNAAQTASAIGIAADMSGGTLEPVRTGADDWRIQNGSAAWRGAISAVLAQAGVLGSASALEGDKGFARAFAGMPAPDRWSSAPDERSILTVWEKAFPTLGDNIAVSLAACEIARQLEDTSSVTKIVVHQNAEFASYPGTSFRGPYVRAAQAMASTAFAVATSLVRGEISVDMYETSLRDPEVIRLIECLHIAPERDYAYTDGTVEVTHAGGRLSASTRDLPKTLLYRDEVEAKKVFLEILGERGDPQKIEDFADIILGGQSFGSSADLSALLAGLSSLFMTNGHS